MMFGNRKSFCFERVLIVVFVSVFAGCASVSTEPFSTMKAPSATLKKLDVSRVNLGMTSDQVKDLLRDTIVLGYEIKRSSPPSTKPIYFKNPYRTEIYRQDTLILQIDYYFSGIQKQDGFIGDEELLPLVFEKDQLIGQGWHFLEMLPLKKL